MTDRLKVMLVVPEATGHNMALYTKYIVKAAVAFGWELSLLTTLRATKHPAYEMVQNEARSRLQTRLLVLPPPRTPYSTYNLIRNQIAVHHAYKLAFHAIDYRDRPDFIYVINLELLDKAIALLGSPFGTTSFGGMLMSLRIHHKAMGIQGPPVRISLFSKFFLYKFQKTCYLAKVSVNDELFPRYTDKVRWLEPNRFVYIPEVAALNNSGMTMATSRSKLGIGMDQFVLLVYGSLSLRKGIDSLLNAVSNTLNNHNITVILAGQQVPEVTQIVRESRADNCYSIVELPYFLNEEQEESVFVAADVVWLGYRNFGGMSGVLVSAASIGKPVIACEQGMIGWMTREYKLGITVDVNDINQVMDAIASLAKKSHLASVYSANAKEIADKHSGQQFGENVCSLITSSMA